MVGDIQAELDIPNSTLSHHLEKLKNEDLVTCAVKAHFCATQPTRKRCRNCCNSSMPNAALEIRQSNPQEIVQLCK